MNEQVIDLKLTVQEANIVLMALNETPLMKLIQKIQTTAQEQLKPEEEKK
jgi:hypothetical protein